jgi:hypothetical protein
VIGDVLVQVAEHAPDGRSFQLGRGFLVSQFPTTAEVLSSGKASAVTLDDPAADAAEAAVLRDLAVRGVLMLALRDGSAAWGLVEVYRLDPAAFAPDEIERAATIVGWAEVRLQAILDTRRRG